MVFYINSKLATIALATSGLMALVGGCSSDNQPNIATAVETQTIAGVKIPNSSQYDEMRKFYSEMEREGRTFIDNVDVVPDGANRFEFMSDTETVLKLLKFPEIEYQMRFGDNYIIDRVNVAYDPKTGKQMEIGYFSFWRKEKKGIIVS